MLQAPLGRHQPAVVAVKGREGLQQLGVLVHPPLQHRQPQLRGLVRRRQVLQQPLPIRRRQRAVLPAGHAAVRVDLPPAHGRDGRLPVLAQEDPLDRGVRGRGQYPEDVPLGRVAVEAQQQVRARQVEEAQRMRLNQLPHVHQLAQQQGRPRGLHAHDVVDGLGAGQVVADRADAADPLGERRHLGEVPPFAELLEAAELHHVQPGLVHLPRIVQLDRDLAMPFNPRYGLYRDLLCHVRATLLSRRVFNHGDTEKGNEQG